MSLNGNRFDLTIKNDWMESRVFWARTVSSEHESLFTQYTKHTFYEIQYALEGHIGMTVGQDTALRVDESDFVIIPPDTYHQVVDADSRGARFIMGFSFEPRDARMRELCRALHTCQPHREAPNMRPLLSLILSEHRGRLGRRVLSALLESFLLEVLAACQGSDTVRAGQGSEQGRRDTLVREMQRYIASAGGIGVSVRELAAQFNVSERHVGRLFQEALGRSPREVIQHERLKKIEEYVASTDLSLFEIATLCGFCDEYAMNKFFKRYNRTNLSDFRRIAKRR